MTNTRRLLPLRRVELTDVVEVGGKAAVLGALAQAGFPVPDGFVLTAAVTALSDVEIEQTIAAARRLGGRVAVRSSAVAEDGPERSYAGQFDTVLNVAVEELAKALRTCVASATGDPVGAYAGLAEQPMAVLVQRMVDADAAGVAFTANPVTGDPEVLVNAVCGLGDRLVSGLVDADGWVIGHGSTRLVHGAVGAISADQAKQIAALAIRVAEWFGVPQDIEWALAGGELVLLQARPITALPVPVPVQPPPGYWLREATHAPQPLSPLMKSCWPIEEAMRQMAEEYGFLATPTPVQIGGWEYFGMVPVGAPPGWPTPPAWVLAALGRVVPAIRRRVRQCRVSVRTDRPSHNVDRWFTEWRPQFADRIQVLRDVDVATLDDKALDDHIEATVNLLGNGTKIHFIVDFGHLLAVSEFGLACQDLLSWDDARLFELCAGLSPTSTEPARELAELARFAADRPAVRSMLELSEPDLAAADLKAVDPEFAEAFAAYQRTYGCRALHFDITQPTIAETPELTLALLRDQLARDYDPHAERSQLAITRAAAEQLALAAVPIAERDRFRQLLTRAQRAYPAREDNEFFAISAPLALVRLAALEAGQRLATRGLLGAPDDVFFLVLDEIHASLRAGVDQRTVARRRRDEQAWTLAHPGPASYGRDPGPPPSLTGFPDEVRQTARTVEWFVGRALNPGDYIETDFGLVGVSASPGRYCGPARVISDESEFGKLKCGDVLVCRTTTPVWSVLFPRLGAIITDTGGSLSHPAIIAREYRVPAVVATGRATEVLRDGQIVTVDGSAGTVELQP